MPEQPHDLELTGCAPEPLMAYLKALGVLRLVAEQADPSAHGWWRNDVFWLRTTLDRNGLVAFFLEKYRPTPILVPWTGSDFFGVNADGNAGPFAQTPTATTVIEAFLASTTDRLAQYRAVIKAVCGAMAEIGVTKKEDIDSQKGKAAKRRKAAFFSHLRQSLDEDVLGWIDAAGICAEDLQFSALLGSGGGSDGNTHFSDNFMQNLWDVLPDFDAQRNAKGNQQRPSARETSDPLLRSALFEDAGVRLTAKRTSSLYDSGGVGGPNATQGMERNSLANPWNIILALEGTIAFAGAATKRLGVSLRADAVFPFQVSAVATEGDGLADKERSGSEIWLPLWNRPALAGEVLTLLCEGRAQCGERIARSGIDMARAAATLGIDRGVDVFGRYAIIKGRVGGDNYNTASSLGRFAVHERRDADLLRQIDTWLDSFRRATTATKPEPPPRFRTALRQIDSAVFDFCRYGGKPLFQNILIALGRAERELARASGKEGVVGKQKVYPLAGLARQWIDAADDESGEFAIARALAGIHYKPDRSGETPKLGPLRTNLEPVDWTKRCRAWAEKKRAVVWNSTDLPTNLVSVLARRMMDGDRNGCEDLPLASAASAPLAAIASFIAGDLDDRRVEDLLWGLVLVQPKRHHPAEREVDSAVPAAYALLKLLFLPRPLMIERRENGGVLARYAKQKERGVQIRPEPRVVHLLRAGQLGEACVIAMRRLRASGLAPMPRARAGRTRDGDWKELDRMGAAGVDPIRLAAALLIPIDERALQSLITLISRTEHIETEPEPAASLAPGD